MKRAAYGELHGVTHEQLGLEVRSKLKSSHCHFGDPRLS